MSPVLLDTHFLGMARLLEPKPQSRCPALRIRGNHGQPLHLAHVHVGDRTQTLSWRAGSRQTYPRLACPCRNLAGLQIAQITPAIAAEGASLPPAFHGDPADRILAATARSNGLILITHDKALLKLAASGFLQAMPT